MLDSSPIESQIDSSFPDNTTRQIKPAGIRVFLKTLVRWVRDAVNSNLSTWARTSDNTPGGANTEDIFRVGITRFKGSMEAYTRNPDGKVLALVANDQAAMRILSQNGGPAYVEFHHPGIRFDNFGTDQDGILKFAPGSAGVSYPVFISGLTPLLAFSSIIARRKVVLYQGADNNYQFYGFGIEGGKLVYSVNSVADAHVFYAGISPATSQELARLTGAGNLGIGHANPQLRLEVATTNPLNGLLASFSNQTASGNGTKIRFILTDTGIWDIGMPSASNSFIIAGWDGSAIVERVRIDGNGNMGVGTAAPTARLHAKSPNGFDQLRLEDKYTPTGPGDPNGQVGAYAWDDAWFYIKTTAGWRRMQLQGW